MSLIDNPEPERALREDVSEEFVNVSVLLLVVYDGWC